MNNLELPPEKDPDITSTDETSLLVIILDTNPTQKLLRDKANQLTNVVDSVISFANSHLMQKAQNKVAIMACHSKTRNPILKEKIKLIMVCQDSPEDGWRNLDNGSPKHVYH